MRRFARGLLMLSLAVVSVLVVPTVAASRPASTTVAPAKTAKPGHGKKPQIETSTVVVEPWTQSPRYGAPWKAAPDPITATSKGTSQRVTGSAYEFFFWVLAVLTAVVSGLAITARVRATRLAPWEARPTPERVSSRPIPQPGETSPTQ